MSILPLIHTTFALMLSQSPIDTSNCDVFWLDKTAFGTIAAVELAELETAIEVSDNKSKLVHPITAKVVCRKMQATVIVTSMGSTNTCPPLKRVVSLYDTPEDTRTRTLALTVSDTVKDYVNGISSCRWAAKIKAQKKANNSPPQKRTDSSNSNPSMTLSPLQSYRGSPHHQLAISGLTALSHPHFAASINWHYGRNRWRLGLQTGGMRFTPPSGKVLAGHAAMNLGFSVFGFVTNSKNVGDLSIALLLGAVHARGFATAPAVDEKHTQPLAAGETAFTFLIDPLERNTLGLRIFAGWMLGMTVRASGEKLGGFNGFYAGCGLVVLLQSKQRGMKRNNAHK